MGFIKKDMGDLVTQNMEKAEVLNEGKGSDRKNEELFAVGDHKVQGHLRNLKEHRSMGHEEKYPWALRELEVVKLLSIMLEE